MKFSSDRSIVGAFLLATVLIGVLGYLAFRAFDQEMATSRWVDHSQVVIDRLQRVLTGVERASTDLQGYFLTHDPVLRQGLQDVRHGLPGEIQGIKSLTADNVDRARDLPLLEKQTAEYVAILGDEMQAFDAHLTPATPDLQRSRDALAAVERRVAAIQEDERQLLVKRNAAAQVSARWAKWMIGGGAMAALFIVGINTVLLANSMDARQHAEETLRANERRVRLMVDSVKDYAIIMLDAKGNIVGWNSGAQRMLGYQTDEIMGRHFATFYPADRIREKHPEKELAETARLGHFEDEGWRVRADGTRFLANVVFTAVRGEDGTLLGFVKITRDVTEARATERRIRDLNHELAERASQAEAGNKELEAFSYSVSHDLRAPLRHIAGFVDMLRQAPAIQGDATSRRYTEIVGKAARQMGTLIDDLLALSRTGRAEMNLARIEMREIIDQVIADMEIEWKDRDVQWEIGEMEPVRGDPPLLRQVWANLISNALKYTRPRKVARIEIGEDRLARRSGEEVVFFIRDNGVGFNMKYADKLFGVFQRLHRSDEFEGTGIGLANVQRIIHRHGGRIWAESEPEAGTTFRFSLPRKFHENLVPNLPIPEPCLS